VGDNLAEQAGLDVTLDDDDAVVILQRRRDEAALLVEREAARVDAAGGRGLDERQGARLGVDAVRDERVRGQGGRVGGVKVGDGQELLAAGRDDEELVVGLGFLLVLILQRSWKE